MSGNKLSSLSRTKLGSYQHGYGKLRSKYDMSRFPNKYVNGWECKPVDPCVDPCSDPCKPIDPCADPCADPCKRNGWGNAGTWGQFIIWFIIITVIIWFILYSVKPDFIRRTTPDGTVTEEIDNGRALVWAIVIALIIVILIGLFTYRSW